MDSLSTAIEPKENGWLEAAVLVLCYQRNGEDHVVLTKRTETVLHHKGQICFPGGSVDPTDGSLWETALRETQEELGVVPTSVRLVKELKPQKTPTGFRVTPFVAHWMESGEWQPNPVEIAEVFSVPFSFFSNRKNVDFRKLSHAGEDFIDPVFVFEGREIWGMTGRILCELFEIRF